MTNLLLAGGVVGPPLFVVVFLIEGATRPGYSVTRNYVSQLALSDQGWEQIANFLLCGTLCIGLAIGLRRAWPTGKASVWGPLLIGAFGLGLVIAGLFVTDPALGYPPGTPLKATRMSWHGLIHGLNAPFTFAALTAATFVIARRFDAESDGHRWAVYSRVTGLLQPAFFVVSTAAEVANLAGLFQRPQLIIGWLWVSLVALRVLRQRRSDPARPRRRTL